MSRMSGLKSQTVKSWLLEYYVCISGCGKPCWDIPPFWYVTNQGFIWTLCLLIISDGL